MTLGSTAGSDAPGTSPGGRIPQTAWLIVGAAAVLFIVLSGWRLFWGPGGTAAGWHEEVAQLREQVNPAQGYALPVSYGDLGPRLLEAGVIDLEVFARVMASGGDALDARQTAILEDGSTEAIIITAEDARFLLDFFWAVGLANRNPILTDGPMTRHSNGQVERFASTGGWTIGGRPVTELYAGLELITLTAEQQARVEEVAAAVYRPCCDNPALFPDCNHGMAMLGMLELMASEGATADEMFEAAKYLNAFWFPQQSLEIAAYLEGERGVSFAEADAREVVGPTMSSSSGAGIVHEALRARGILDEAPGGAGGCTS